MAYFEKAIYDRIQDGLKKAGFYMVSVMRRNLNVPQRYVRKGSYIKGLDPSLPGQFPKKLSGTLLKSISHRTEPLKLTVGTSLKYGKYLQVGTKTMEPRPWLSMTWDKEKDNVARIILGG